MRKANSGLLLHPLTHKNSQGILYVRDSKVEMQIVSALGLDTASLLERVRFLDYKSPDYFQEECLVYLIREYLLRGQDDIVTSLFEALTKRCANRINKHLQALKGDYREEAFHDVITGLVCKIIDLDGNSGDFLQVRFWVVLDSITIDIFRRYINEQNLDEQTIRPAAIGGSDPDKIDEEYPERVSVTDVADSSPSVELGVQCREGLNAIKNSDHRNAFILLKYEGWPIEATDPDEPTISGYFKKTPRTIRNWIACAERDLKRWRGEIKA